ncbi:MAG: 5'-deoxynucleotidase [Phycisphaerae bacterium]|nr:5'-deoxynucleotidase [Phycisphaerae bacterium]
MSHFFAYLSKMKYIHRWGLMRNTKAESIQEHSLQVAMVAHGLALVKNRRFGGQVNPGHVAVLALFHDAGEVITGDLPTPIKYFNPQIEQAYSQLEGVARGKLLGMLPEEFRADYEMVLCPAPEDKACWELVKAADRICAYLKCVEELKAGNTEFSKAAKAIRASIAAITLPEVAYFVQEYLPSFSLTLDELN